MDGSIAASASVRMRDQLRGAFHAPTAGTDAGLFEELLRMPIAQTRPEPAAAKAPAPDDAAEAQAAAQEARHKSTNESQREDDDDADDKRDDESRAANSTNPALASQIAAQPTPLEAPRPHDDKLAATADDSKVRTRGATSKTADKNGHPAGPVQAPAAAVDRSAAPVKSSAAAADAPQAAQVVETAPGAQTAPVVEPTAAVDDGQAAPVADALTGDAADSDQTPAQAGDAKPAVKAPAAVQSVPVAVPVAVPATAQTQPDSPRAPNKPQTQAPAQPSSSIRAQPAAPPAEAPLDKPAARTDAGERREKWYLKDAESPDDDEAQAAGASAKQDAPHVDPVPVPNAMDPTSAPPNSDTLVPTSDAVQSDAAQAAAAQAAASVDASALAQQNGGSTSDGTASSSRNDPRAAALGVGHVGGGRPASGASAHVDGAPDRNQGGVAGLSQQERVRLVQRVARSFSRLGPDGGQVTLKLHPPQLGVLSMSVRIEGQSMTARLQTETTGARDAILENLPVLRDRLAEQGIEVESFHVEVASDRNPATDTQSQSPNQNPFSGDSSGDSRGGGGARDIDYRRLSRSNSDLQSVVAGSMRVADQARWSAPSPLERSLDVRA